MKGRVAGRVIAIDGPSASGKSTVARRVAAALRRSYVDSGALYRAVTVLALEAGLEPADMGGMRDLLAGCSFEPYVAEGAVRFRIGRRSFGDELRSRAVTEAVSPVSALPEVRKKVVGWLREMRRFGDLVVEGRDIGTVVFPDAQPKFYLDASAEERARRRIEDRADRSGRTPAEVAELLSRRDGIDSTRSIAPLRPAPDAVIVDTNSLSADEVAELIVKRAKEVPC
jgi:cytidylate kinase